MMLKTSRKSNNMVLNIRHIGNSGVEICMSNIFKYIWIYLYVLETCKYDDKEKIGEVRWTVYSVSLR